MGARLEYVVAVAGISPSNSLPGMPRSVPLWALRARRLSDLALKDESRSLVSSEDQ